MCVRTKKCWQLTNLPPSCQCCGYIPVVAALSPTANQLPCSTYVRVSTFLLLFLLVAAFWTDHYAHGLHKVCDAAFQDEVEPGIALTDSMRVYVYDVEENHLPGQKLVYSYSSVSISRVRKWNKVSMLGALPPFLGGFNDVQLSNAAWWAFLSRNAVMFPCRQSIQSVMND